MDTILYLGGGLTEALPGARRAEDGAIEFCAPGAPPWKRERRLVQLTDARAAADFVNSHAVDVAVIEAASEESQSFDDSPAGQFLARLYPDREHSASLPADRVIGLVADGPSGIESAHRFGQHQIGTVLRAADRHRWIERAEALLARRRVGRIALCLAGGGIEGLFYELGVLRALETFLVDRAIVDFDLFCGISAGAMLGAFLANGVGPTEIGRAMQGGSGKLDMVERAQIFDPNVREMGRRIARLARGIVTGKTGARSTLSSLTRAIPSAAFAGDRIEQWLERQLTRPGMSNRFSGLRRPLYVGATDQDTSEAVLFSAATHDEVPIHRAVRASSALIPFYAPVEINGRWYIDGAFSRTTNMRVAVDQGATLVILVDPLVPVASKEPGYVERRGGVFGTMQGLKALINGRFDKAVSAIREMFPDVAFHLFRPEGDEMRILSGSPMKYFYRSEVEDIAYARTLDKVRAILPEISRDFARHGVTFSDPAERRAPSTA